MSLLVLVLSESSAGHLHGLAGLVGSVITRCGAELNCGCRVLGCGSGCTKTIAGAESWKTHRPSSKADLSSLGLWKATALQGNLSQRRLVTYLMDAAYSLDITMWVLYSTQNTSLSHSLISNVFGG